MDMTKREVQYHIGLGQGDAGGWCILPGDPGRCQAIAAYFDEPAFVHYVAEVVAQLRGVSTEELADTAACNACRLFGIPEE